MAIKRDASLKSSLKMSFWHPEAIAADFHCDAAGLPTLPGAYLLLLELTASLAIRQPRRPEAVLPAGCYLYCGSAHGPGGIKARVSRHMRRDKAVRWHVDHLTAVGRALGAWVFPGGNECALVASLSALPAPIPGFGSSDCRVCASHLLAWPEEMLLPVAMSLR
jgi:Uri superfamily endonuclease